MRAVLSNPQYREQGQITVPFPILKEEGAQFIEHGHVAYHDTRLLEELIQANLAEQHRQEQGPQMGGLA